MNSPLFQPQALGGVVARGGFEYQDAYLLECIPCLLAETAFSHAVSELLGDIEFRYFRPGGGTYCITYEAKRNQLSKIEFWNEVAHFKELHDAAPDEYVQFVLLCGGFVGEFAPLFNKLARYRGPAEALNQDSSIRIAAEADIVGYIVKLGQTPELARFVLERVAFVQYSDTQVEAGFAVNMGRHFPELDLRRQEENAFRARCKELVAQSVKGVVYRRCIEQALMDSMPGATERWRATPSALQLLGQGFDLGPLGLDVSTFNGPDRGTVGQAAWEQLRHSLAEMGKFVLASRQRRGIRLSAKHRMSVACLLGHTFSATGNFTLTMEHNGQLFDTSDHTQAKEQFFTDHESAVTSTGREGMVSISFPSGSNADVDVQAMAFGLDASPKLSLGSGSAVPDIATLNRAVHEAKVKLAEFRGRHQLSCIHLFIKAPSVFAMALGHRLNGIGVIQLYDWDQGKYIPTVRLS